ncbi:MAG: hypothetical protein H7249_16975 [Chitinophagaceae bacterium]|nr:hypothetical protein [Oligoflexus sp.]
MWKKVSPLIFPLLAVLLLGGALGLGIPTRVAKLNNSYQLYAPPPMAQINPRTINIFLLGHKAIYDDFISIWLLQTLMQTGTPKNPELLMQQVRSVIQHHPKLETTYMLSCFTLWRELNHPEFCREISEAGLVAFPMSWRILMTQAFVEYALMNHPAQAATFFMMAAQRENAPPYVKKAAEKLLKTRVLTDEDIQQSMELISQSEGKTQFMGMLKKIQESKPKAP